MTELTQPCTAAMHGRLNGADELTFDPDCHTCWARKTLGAHDHLHLNPGFVCTTPGLTGEPGKMVKCRCGAFHH